MANENEQENEVKEVVEEASAETNQNENAAPPTEENSGGESSSEKSIPYSRFKEVNDQKNSEREARRILEDRLREVEARLPTNQAPDVTEVEVKRLMAKLDMKEEAAREIVESVNRVSQANAQATRAELSKRDWADWNKELAVKHKDFDALAPEMEREFSRLSAQEKQLVTSSKRGLEMFYHDVRSNANADGKSFESGAKKAYETKALKEAASSSSGKSSSSNASVITREWIKNASVAEYKKRLPEINKMLAEGKLK